VAPLRGLPTHLQSFSGLIAGRIQRLVRLTNEEANGKMQSRDYRAFEAATIRYGKGVSSDPESTP
jgi:hypothetical protein